MLDSAPIVQRQQARSRQHMQPGVILSYTTVHHPPAGFPNRPRRIAIIELEDKTKVIATLKGDAPVEIGQKVMPRMSFVRTNAEGLRLYDVSYEPIVGVREPLRQNKFPGYILALTGPSGVGKTTVNMLLSATVSEYVENVPIVTTREAKPHDGNEYTYVSEEEFIRMEKQGKMVAATRIPSRSEQRWYGYLAHDIEAIWAKGKLPTVVTEMQLLKDLSEHYGRRSILSFGLLPPGRSKRAMLSALLHRLRTRGRDSEKSIQDRLKNAEVDLQFFKNERELFDDLIVNEDLDAVISLLKGHVMKAVEA